MPDEQPTPRETAAELEITGPRRVSPHAAVRQALGEPTAPRELGARRPLPDPSYAHIMAPKLQTVRSRMVRGESAHGWRWLIVGAIGLLFWAFALGVIIRVLEQLRAVPEIGSLLAGKVLGLAFVSFFMILLLSNIITALSTFFLARDLDMLVSTPVDAVTIYAAKLTESLVHSSWMVTLMAVPIFGAYGWVYKAGWGLLPVAIGVFVPFIIIPAVMGAAATNLLVNAFPARRTRDILSVVAVVAAAGLVLVFRLLRPEQLARPEGLRSLVDFIALLKAPSSPFLPSEWVARATMSWVNGRLDPLPFYLLWSSAAAAVVIGAAIHKRLYPLGFSKAQESAQRWVRVGRLTPAFDALWARMSVLRRHLVLKELRVFFRDTTQWSQLILLAVLVVVYVLNVKLLPLKGPGMTAFLVNAIPFLNLGLAGFVLASIAARFIFPAVSMEGRTLWLLKSSPLPMRQLLWAKFWTGTLPLLFLAAAIVGVTDALLHVSAFTFLTSILSILLMTFAVSGLALGLGTVFPQYDTENAAQIPTSFGGLVFMILSMGLVGAVVVLEAAPVMRYVRAGAFGTPIDPRTLVPGLASAALLCVIATIVPLVVALRRLESLEL